MPKRGQRGREGEGPDLLEQLYSVEPEEFVSERNRMARSLRNQGRTAEAEEVAGRRKPPLPVFAANRLAHTRPDDVAALLATAERLAAGHREGRPESVREAQGELGERIQHLVRHAEEAVGRPLSDPLEQRLAALLRAAAVDPAGASLLRRGVLPEELEASGFEALAGMSLAPGRVQRKGDRQDELAARRANAARRRRIEGMERELAEARELLRAAERRLVAAEREAESARKRVADLEERLERAGRSV